MKRLTVRQKAGIIAEAARDKKALDIVVMDMRKVSSLADYFVVSSGNSGPHVRAIVENIEEKLKEAGVRSCRTEGLGSLLWVLLDCKSVIAHVFNAETRQFYGLERLWGDAPKKYIE